MQKRVQTIVQNAVQNLVQYIVQIYLQKAVQINLQRVMQKEGFRQISYRNIFPVPVRRFREPAS